MATYTGADKRLQYLFEHGGGGGGSANIWTGTMAEYLAQASQIADGTQINITDDEIQSLVVASYDIYSEQEREVGVWIDGKPLYARTVKYGYAPNNSAVSVNHNISDIDRIINAVGRGWNSSSGTFYPIPFVQRSQASYQIQFTANKTSIEVATGSNLFTAVEIVVTMLYTKTTDTAGSGLFVPSGAAAHHFSETEHVIGTWIDGRTIYEKTIDFGALPANTQKNVNHGISNFDLIIEIIATATRPASQGTHTSISIPSTHWESISNQNEMSVNDTTIMIRNHNSGFSAWTQTYVTLRYTKTT